MYSVPSQKCTSAAHVLHVCCTHLVGYTCMCWMSTIVMCYTCVKTTIICVYNMCAIHAFW